jgi:hypothetical protein
MAFSSVRSRHDCLPFETSVEGTTCEKGLQTVAVNNKRMSVMRPTVNRLVEITKILLSDIANTNKPLTCKLTQGSYLSSKFKKNTVFVKTCGFLGKNDRLFRHC